MGRVNLGDIGVLFLHNLEKIDTELKAGRKVIDAARQHDCDRQWDFKGDCRCALCDSLEEYDALTTKPPQSFSE